MQELSDKIKCLEENNTYTQVFDNLYCFLYFNYIKKIIQELLSRLYFI